MDAPNVKFKVTDLTATVGKPTDGITFVMGRALRGAINDASRVFTTWPNFVKHHGSTSSDDSALMVRRLLEKGGKVRFCKPAHYATSGQDNTLSAVKAIADDEILDEDDAEVFELVMKYPGADYNNITATISNASNGLETSFNLAIEHALEPELNEYYPNLTIEGTENLSPSTATYLNKVVNGSEIVNVIYKTLSGAVRPVNGTITFSGGSDGGSITDTDVIGNSANNSGLHAFNDYDDALQMIIVGDLVTGSAIDVAAEAYVENRQDLMYFTHLDNSYNSTNSALSYKDSVNFTSKMVKFTLSL